MGKDEDDYSRVAHLIDIMKDSKLDIMLTILCHASDDSDQIEE